MAPVFSWHAAEYRTSSRETKGCMFPIARERQMLSPLPAPMLSTVLAGGYSPGSGGVTSPRCQGGTFPIAEAASSPSPSAPAAGLRAAGVSRTPHLRWRRRPRPGGAAPHPRASADRGPPGHLCQHRRFSLLPPHVLGDAREVPLQRGTFWSMRQHRAKDPAAGGGLRNALILIIRERNI